MKTRQAQLKLLESEHKKEFSIEIHQLKLEWSLLLEDPKDFKEIPQQSKETVSQLQQFTKCSQKKAEQVIWDFEKTKTKSLLLQPTLSSTFEDLITFYYQERVATLLLVQSVIRASQDPLHSYYHECKQVCSDWVEQGFKSKVLKAWKEHRSIQVPLTDPNDAKTWTRWHTTEQKSFLELLILLFYFHCPTPTETCQVLESLIDFEIGMKQPNRHYMDTTPIVSLCTILFLEVLNYEMVIERVNCKKNTKLLLDDPLNFTKTNDLIWKFCQSWNGDVQILGLVSVGWACYSQTLLMILNNHCPNEYKDLYYLLVRGDLQPQKLFQFGYECGLREWKRILGFVKRDQNEVAYKCILKGLLAIITTTQNVGSLPDRHELVECATLTFGNDPEMTNFYWSEYKRDPALLLEVTKRAFPAQDDFLVLICGLIGDPDSADCVFRYCSRVDGLTDLARNEYESSFEMMDGQNVFFWRGEGFVKGAIHITLDVPKGTRAIEIADGVVTLDCSYSVWRLCLSLLDSFLHSSEDDGFVGTIRSTELILRLMNTVLEYADSNTQLLFLNHVGNSPGMHVYGGNPQESLTGIIGEILNRCCNHSVVPTQIITGCLDIMRHLVHTYPETVWKRLRVQRLLPQYSTSPIVNPGYIQHSVLPMECNTGRYPATLSFLKLVKELVLEAQVMASPNEEMEWMVYDILYCCLLFILREIFPVYGGWRYLHIREKFEIGLLITEILGTVMSTVWYFMNQDGKRVSGIQSLVIEVFVDKPSLYQLSPLLDMVAIGNAVPLQYHVLGHRYEAELLEKSIVEGLKLLRQFFVYLSNHDQGISGLERAILDRSVRLVDGSQSELLQVVANYIDYQNNAEFAILSTELLTILCKLSKRKDRPSTSFVGYFGDDAFTIVSKFVELVDDESKRASASGIVQMSIYNFVSAVIECQPGLGAMFLNGCELSGEETSTDDIKKSSILIPLTHSIANWKSVVKEKPCVLAAVLNLLDVLWRFASEHNGTLTKLRKRSELWTSLCELLKGPNDLSTSPYFFVARSRCLRVLATEGIHILRNGASDKVVQTIKDVLFGMWGFAQNSFPHDSQLTTELVELCGEIVPPINMNYFRRLTWDEVFDPERLFGPDFIYNTTLLEKFLDLEHNNTIAKKAGRIMSQVELVNENWSLTHAQLETTRQFTFATHLITSSFYEKLQLEIDQVYDVMVNIFKSLKRKDQSYIHTVYKTELTLCLNSLIKKWISMARKNDQDKIYPQIVELLHQLEQIFMVAEFPIGPIGKFSEFPFHQHILSAVLLLVQFEVQIKKQNSESIKLNAVYKSLLPIVCHGLYFALGNPSPTFDAQLLISTLIQIIKSSPCSVWLPYLEKYRILELILQHFQGSADVEQCVLLLCLLNSLSGFKPCAVLLVKLGIISTLCNNGFTFKIVNPDEETVIQQVEIHVHKIWCLFLAILTQLVRHVPDLAFLESVIGFVKVYESRIRTDLVFPNESFSHEDVERTERTIGLLYILQLQVLQRVQANEIEGEYDMFQEFIPDMLRRVSVFVFLFKNPNELKTRTNSKLEADIEKQNVIRKRMEFCIGCILEFLSVYSRLDESALDCGLNLFVGTMSTHGTASFGTIIDLIRYLLSGSESQTSTEKNMWICEVGALLLYAQLKGMQLDEVNELRNEVMNVVGDLKSVGDRAFLKLLE